MPFVLKTSEFSFFVPCGSAFEEAASLRLLVTKGEGVALKDPVAATECTPQAVELSKSVKLEPVVRQNPCGAGSWACVNPYSKRGSLFILRHITGHVRLSIALLIRLPLSNELPQHLGHRGMQVDLPLAVPGLEEVVHLALPRLLADVDPGAIWGNIRDLDAESIPKAQPRRRAIGCNLAARLSKLRRLRCSASVG